MRVIERIKAYVRTDGLLHIACSSVAVMALRQLLLLLRVPFPLLSASVLSFIVGIYKECYDGVSKKGSVETHDIVCDVIGIAISALFLWPL